MSLSASERRLPFEIAQVLLDHIEERDSLFLRAEITRPGFLNLTVQRGCEGKCCIRLKRRVSSMGTVSWGQRGHAFSLMRDSSTHFDLELGKQQSQENPVCYVQHARARIASLLRVVASRGIECPRPSQEMLGLLEDPDELALIRKLSAFPVVMEASAVELEPHRMTYHLRELAGKVHPFYNKHRILPPVTNSETNGAAPPDSAPAPNRGTDSIPPGVTGAGLALMWAVPQVVRNGLNVLGVSAPEQM